MKVSLIKNIYVIINKGNEDNWVKEKTQSIPHNVYVRMMTN